MEAPTQTPQSLAPLPKPLSSTIKPITNVTLRIFTLIFLIIALIILAVDKGTMVFDDGSAVLLHARDYRAYKYVISVAVIGIIYTLIQIPVAVYRLIAGKFSIAVRGSILLDFYGDKVLSYLLATAAAAGFGVAIDTKDFYEAFNLGAYNIFNNGNAASSLVLFAFFFSVGSSMLSSYALSRIN